MQVHELQSINGLSGFQLAAGKEGLRRDMHSVVIFEYDSVKLDDPHYYEGDFLITSLVFAKDQPELIAPTIHKMCMLGASGIAIKTIYYKKIPAEALEAANQYHVPIFLFQDIYIERVILYINEYLRREQDFSRYEHELEQMLTQNIPAHLVKSMCAGIVPQLSANLMAFFLRSTESAPRETMQRLLDAMLSRSSKRLLIGFRILLYQDGIFLLYSFDAPHDVKQAAAEVFSRLYTLGIHPTAYRIGISEIHTNADELDLCIRESYYAQDYGRMKQSGRTYYEEIGLFQVIFPMLYDKSAMRAYRHLFGRLQTYDAETNGCLTETICAYAAQGCDVQKTAQVLCQHPNTIRYRLGRAGEVLDELPAGSFAHVAYFLAAIHSVQGGEPACIL